MKETELMPQLVQRAVDLETGATSSEEAALNLAEYVTELLYMAGGVCYRMSTGKEAFLALAGRCWDRLHEGVTELHATMTALKDDATALKDDARLAAALEALRAEMEE